MMMPLCNTFILQVIEQELKEREEAKQKREQAALLESRKGEDVSDTDLMNKMFDFLDEDEGSQPDGRTTDVYGGVGDRTKRGQVIDNGYNTVSRPPLAPIEDEEDLSEFTFSKFATTYFQGQWLANCNSIAIILLLMNQLVKLLGIYCQKLSFKSGYTTSRLVCCITRLQCLALGSCLPAFSWISNILFATNQDDY